MECVKDRMFGHNFDATIAVEYKRWDRDYLGECTFEWWEWSGSRPAYYPSSARPNEWFNVAQFKSYVPEWYNKTPPSAPGPSITLIPDKPAIGVPRPSFVETYSRVLYFAITVKSHPDCPCSISYVTAFATQELAFDKYKITKWHFDTGIANSTVLKQWFQAH